MLTLVTAAAPTLSREERIRLALNTTVLETLSPADLDEALKLAAEIEPRDPDLARAVHQRLRSFRFDEIEAALGGDAPGIIDTPRR